MPASGAPSARTSGKASAPAARAPGGQTDGSRIWDASPDPRAVRERWDRRRSAGSQPKPAPEATAQAVLLRLQHRIDDVEVRLQCSRRHHAEMLEQLPGAARVRAGSERVAQALEAEAALLGERLAKLIETRRTLMGSLAAMPAGSRTGSKPGAQAPR